ncbi:hypothetical protein DL96DRAFT_1584836 [Flagelloscypha sp. PMI_526]|nr:hypothetical protein DL96DRAFT_1584836 [Flagelloscypha sp. PMI_526]
MDALLHEDPEDILSSSLETFYDHKPVTLSTTPGSLYTYIYPHSHDIPPIVLETPDTLATNWSLHASSIWASSKFMADHILHNIALLSNANRPFQVLEVGAGAGLPGIVFSLLHPPDRISVTITDYPDDLLIKTLSRNVIKNTKLRGNCRAVGYGWGTNPVPTLFSATADNDLERQGFYDVIVGADTLWNPDFHSILLSSLCSCLRREATSRIHLVAGLHTGRYTLEAFFRLAEVRGFEIEKLVELESSGAGRRDWRVERADEGEEEQDRRRWVVWIVLKWNSENL